MLHICAHDFCTCHIKYLKLCSTFSQALSKRWHLYCNEYTIVLDPPQSNLPFHKIYWIPFMRINNIYALMEIKGCAACYEGQSIFNHVIYQFDQT